MMAGRIIKAEGLRWTDPNASAASNIIIGTLDAFIVVAAVAAVFYFRSPKVRAKRALAIDARNRKYEERKAVKLAKRESTRNSNFVQEGTTPGKFTLWYASLSDNHLAKRLVRFIGKLTVLFWEVFFIAVFIVIVAIVIALALHNGSCIGPEGDYSTCYP